MNARDIILPASSAALERIEVLDSQPEAAFDELARQAATALQATMAGISFFDRPANPSLPWREWFKARAGFPARALSQAESFFLPASDARADVARTFVVPDLLGDKRFRDHRLVAGPPNLCFFAGAAVLSGDREIIGAVAVFDTVARDCSQQELDALVRLADLVAARLEARLQTRVERRATQPTYSDFTETDEKRLAQLSHELVQVEQKLEDAIVARKSAEEQFLKEQQLVNAAIDSLPGAFFMFDARMKMARWNRNFSDMTGHTEGEVKAATAIDFIAPPDRPRVAEAVRRVFERGEEVRIEAAMQDKAGAHVPYAFHARLRHINDVPYCVGIGRDISDRKRSEQEIRRAKERLDLALAGSNLAIWDWDLSRNEIFFSQEWGDVLGVRPIDESGTIFSGDQVIAWNHVDDRAGFVSALMAAAKGENSEFNFEYRVRGDSQEWAWMHSKGKVTERDPHTGRALRMTGTTANITLKKSAEARVEFLATRDPLTGLPNRMLLNDRLEHGVALAARKSSRLAFMFIDLDRFKTINDSLGHDVGDELLKRVAARLSACVRTTDTVARLGGDEFAVILENLPQGGDEEDQEGAQHVADKMIAALGAPILINGNHLTTSCSIGIGVYPTDGHDPQTLMKHADVAMYDAKAKGRNNYQFFSHEMNARAQERLSIENFLRLALRRDELVLYYQPRVSFLTGKVTGAEALLRWKHPLRGLVTPDKFIHVAEDSGLIVPIGEWVFEHAFAQIAQWRQKSGIDLRLAVNLSAAQLFDGDRLIRAIEIAAQAASLDPSVIELELTESMLLKNIDETAALLERLGQSGLGVAIDDFGTGYSSLSYLKKLPVDSIKVDSSFVRDIGTDPNDEAIIRAIIAMTHSLKLNVVAEGVENEEQYRVLRDLECDEYQGYFFARPLPAAEFEAEFLDAQ